VDLEAANTRSAEVSKELTAARAAITDRDRELDALRKASAKDAAALQSFRDRFRSFEAATQSIMAGIALSDGAPANVEAPAIEAPAEAVAPDVQTESSAEEVSAPAVEAPAEEVAAPAAKASTNVVPDPFDLKVAPAPVGIGPAGSG